MENIENLQAGEKEFEVTDFEKVSIDLSGFNWQMEGTLPGRGVEIGFHEINLDITGDAFNWSYAQVPGDVYSDLWRQGRIEDPHFGRNSVKAKWVPEMEWWYKRQFNLPTEMIGKNLYLTFHGIDFAFDAWLNGHFLGTHEGMFTASKHLINEAASFDFRRHGANVLMIRLHPAPRRYSQVAGRKPAWHGDYWVSLPPTGIWKPITIDAMGEINISDVFVHAEPGDDTKAKIDIELSLSSELNTSEKLKATFTIKGKNHESEAYTFEEDILFSDKDQTFSFSYEIADAKLWFPWDLGDQNLYTIQTRLEGSTGEFQDKTEHTFGIRKIEMQMNPGFTKDEVENPWTVMLNGKRHFMRSGTWGGPPDIFFGRATKSKYKELIRLAKEANLNNLRIFGWHPSEIPYFYELCNEAGITVWQDSQPFASLTIPKDEAYKQIIIKEAIEIVKSQRNHPCLVILEGAEESFMTASDPKFNLEFVKEIGEAIKPFTKLHFVPGSPLSDDIGIALGFKPKESYHANDQFYAEGKLIMEEYFPQLDFAVIPELAISSCPSVESIKKFIPENEIWPPGPSWGHHWCDFDVLKTLNYEVLGNQSIDSIENFVNASQIAQGVIFQYALEHFRRRKPKTSAICICHYITFAPDFKWGIVDYYQEKKKSFDYVKKAYQPLLPSLAYTKRRWQTRETLETELWMVNDLFEDYKNCTAEVGVRNSKNETLATKTFQIPEIKGDSSSNIADVSFKVNEEFGEQFYLFVTLFSQNNNQLAENDYLLLIGNQEEAKKELNRIGSEATATKNKYGTANYYRYFSGLAGEDGELETDEKSITAIGF
jgi:beta-mannosidase